MFFQVKIWFQNRRVKYKKEEGGSAEAPGRCCCLRSCSSAKKQQKEGGSDKEMHSPCQQQHEQHQQHHHQDQQHQQDLKNHQIEQHPLHMQLQHQRVDAMREMQMHSSWCKIARRKSIITSRISINTVIRIISMNCHQRAITVWMQLQQMADAMRPMLSSRWKANHNIIIIRSAKRTKSFKAITWSNTNLSLCFKRVDAMN